MRSYLCKDYKLNNDRGSSYTILDVIGEGASCVAYRAKVNSIGGECIIKEYYPMSIALDRIEDGSLRCEIQEKEKFDEGINRFVESISSQVELRLLESISNQTFCIIDRFYQNNTYYAVVPLFQGETYNSNSEMSLYDRLRVCRSVADYVNRCHKAGYLCLDIKPDNIFVVPETPEFAMFFDFDSLCKVADISFGRTSSYTEKWAAPEQLLPGAFESISCKTDIYILGELIFWSVFDRHSSESEHRRTSKFKISETQFEDEINDDAEDILEELFHNTLRSSVGNRYESVEKVLDKLNDLLIELYPGRESIISLLPTFTPFFVGRELELEGMESQLNEGHKVFLSGVGGIGKSEIAKQFVERHKDEYKSIIYLTYTVDILTTINDSFFLSDFEQKEEETDIHYCNRKINKLAELYTGKNLIVIDNLNIELEDIEHKEIWEKICALPCDLIITTRCNQEAYFRYQLYIDGLKYETLEKLFYNYCQYEENQGEYVKRIISSVHGHTLVVELIARQAKSSLKTPKEMLQLLEEKGILGLNTETVKWDLKKGTISDHVKGLFSIATMTDSQKQLMYMMAFMPVSGVNEKVFLDFYNIENSSDIRYLIDNGWIFEMYGISRLISMHPVITSIVIEELKTAHMIADEMYSKSMTAMMQWSGNEAINQDEYYSMCKSIAVQTDLYNIAYEKAADYLTRYTGAFAKYGNTEQRRNILLKAIDIYDAIYNPEEYIAVRELAYESYVATINDVDHVDDVKRLCKEHLKKAKKHKDLYMQGRWYIRLNNASHVKNSTAAGFSLMYIIYSIKVAILVDRLKIESKKLRHSLISVEYLEKLHYGYMSRLNLCESLYLNLAGCYEQLSENDIFFVKYNWVEAYPYKQAIRIRNRYKSAQSVNSSVNSIYKIIDIAKLDILERKYDDAMTKLQEIVSYFEENDIPPNVNLYVVRDIMGTIALTVGDYQKAISEYTTCLDIASILNYKKNYGIRVGLALAYAMNNDIEESKDINLKLFNDLKEVDRDNRGTFFAEMYYNEAYRFLQEGNLEKAEKNFFHAIKQFNACSIYGNRRDVGIARSKYQLGKMKANDNPVEALNYIKQALTAFNDCLGEEHRETIECKKLLVDLE